MRKLSLLLLFLLTQLVPTNIQSMEENEKKTIDEFFDIPCLPKEIKSKVEQEIIDQNDGFWCVSEKKTEKEWPLFLFYRAYNRNFDGNIHHYPEPYGSNNELNKKVTLFKGNFSSRTKSKLSMWFTKKTNKMDEVITELYDRNKLIANFSEMSKPDITVFNPRQKLVLNTYNEFSAELWNFDDNKIAIFKHSYDILNAAFVEKQNSVCVSIIRYTDNHDFDDPVDSDNGKQTVVLWKKHKSTFEQVLLRKLLNLYVQSTKRNPVKNIEQINTFFKNIEDEFKLYPKELIKIWETFENDKIKRAIFNNIMKRAIK